MILLVGSAAVKTKIELVEEKGEKEFGVLG